MNNPQTIIGTIRPEVLAQKLAAIRNHEYPKLLQQLNEKPRLVEMLWFIQFQSLQPGGLVKFVEDMAAQMPGLFCTASMRGDGSGTLSLQTKISVLNEIPTRFLPAGWDIREADLSVRFYVEDHGGPRRYDDSFGSESLLEEKDDRYAREVRCVESEELAAAKSYFQPWTRAALIEICKKAAVQVLPGYLAALCNEVDKDFSDSYRSAYGNALWFVDDVISAIFEMMDRWTAQVSKRLAKTAVTELVNDALRYALEERAMVRIEGNSRFGKTETLRSFAEMHPGLSRLITVPSSNSLSGLLNRVAEALGIDVSYGSREQRIKEKIEYVLKHGGLFFIFDEAAFLIPQNYTSTTAPARLNWVRTEIIDRRLPVAFAVTPQSFKPQIDRFVKKTGYTFEQFFGRNHRVVILPDRLAPGDMLAVARIHFPEVADELLELVADLAEMSENYLQAVEAIAKLARYIARREKHTRVTVDDVQAAAYQVIPRSLTPEAAPKPEDEPKPPRRRPGAKPVQRPEKPAASRLNLDPSSLPETRKAEPVPA